MSMEKKKKKTLPERRVKAETRSILNLNYPLPWPDLKMLAGFCFVKLIHLVLTMN